MASQRLPPPDARFSPPRGRRRPAALLAAALLGALAGGQAGAADVAAGRALAEKWCSNCHIISGTRQATDAAPPFAVIAADPAKTGEDLRVWLSSPHSAMPEMPLSRREIDDVVAYIRSQAP